MVDESTDHGKDAMMLQFAINDVAICFPIVARANPRETLTEMDVKNCQRYCGWWFPLGFQKMDHNFLWSVQRFHSRNQHLCEFIGKKGVFT